MPKFKVEVKVVKADTYEVEIEADDVSDAESAACTAWREHVSEFFQVDKPDSWEVIDCTQLTWECHQCHTPISEAQYRQTDEMCVACYRKAEQEEIDYWNASPACIRANAWRVTTHAVAEGREVFDPLTKKQWRVTRLAASPITT